MWTPSSELLQQPVADGLAGKLAESEPLLLGGGGMAANTRSGSLGNTTLFATLPLRDIDACLAEIAYAYDVLHVDGSDYSYFPVAHSVAQLTKLALDNWVMQAVGSGNAVRLFPRFDGISAA